MCTATVSGRGAPNVDASAKGADLYMATSGDFDLATRGDFLMATDNHPDLPMDRRSEELNLELTGSRPDWPW